MYTHTHTHTHIHICMYACIYTYACIYRTSASTMIWATTCTSSSWTTRRGCTPPESSTRRCVYVSNVCLTWLHSSGVSNLPAHIPQTPRYTKSLQ